MTERQAVVYLVVNSAPPAWRTRVEQYPEPPGWYGGKVLWGHDKATEDEALALAETWTERGELP